MYLVSSLYITIRVMCYFQLKGTCSRSNTGTEYTELCKFQLGRSRHVLTWKCIYVTDFVNKHRFKFMYIVTMDIL